jgi:hypothetical protein
MARRTPRWGVIIAISRENGRREEEDAHLQVSVPSHWMRYVVSASIVSNVEKMKESWTYPRLHCHLVIMFCPPYPEVPVPHPRVDALACHRRHPLAESIQLGLVNLVTRCGLRVALCNAPACSCQRRPYERTDEDVQNPPIVGESANERVNDLSNDLRNVLVLDQEQRPKAPGFKRVQYGRE